LRCSALRFVRDHLCPTVVFTIRGVRKIISSERLLPDDLVLNSQPKNGIAASVRVTRLENAASLGFSPHP
jgi:hypothetical protein